MLVNNFSWYKSLGIHLLLASSLGVFIFLGFILFQTTLLNNFRFTFNDFSNYYINAIDSNFLIYFSIAGIFYALYHIEKLKLSNNYTAILNKDLTQSKLIALQSQIQPQLLFSGLNTISTLIHNNTLLAQNTTEDLGEYLRETLKLKDQYFIKVKEEVILTNKYLNILGAKFKEQLIVKLNYNNNVKNCMMPNMFLQPLIENVIKHNFKADIKPFEIDIKIIKDNKKINILITSTSNLKKIKSYKIKYKDQDLSNLMQRLELLYNDQFDFQYLNYSDSNAIRISLPIKKN